jgi:SagB-type dehydrogenase family enzyme
MKSHGSTTLVFTLSDEGLIGFNFLQKSGFNCPVEFLDVLATLNKSVAAPSNEVPSEWVQLGAVVLDNSEHARSEQEYLEKWEWGLPAALYHFCVQGNDMRSLEEGEERQRESLSKVGLPELYRSNSTFADVQPLDRKPLNTDVLGLMSRRRSNREVSGRSVSIELATKLLYSGMGITGFTNNAVVQLPLTMTPSGGARNPFEAYLFARNIDGLAPGIYHYSAIEHSLGRLDAPLPEYLSAIVGGQDWADGMAGIIVLAAHFERTMWKYDDPNAYRVVLIEAGHIGQNIVLAATEAGLGTCPTAALNHKLLFDVLDLPSRIMCAPIYAVAFGAL